MKKSLLIIFALLIFASATFSQDDVLVKFKTHNIVVELLVASHSAKIRDDGMMDIKKGWNAFQINQTAVIDTFNVNNKIMEYVIYAKEDSTSSTDEIKTALSSIEIGEQGKYILFQSENAGEAKYLIKFHAEFNDDVEDVRFSNEMVGKEVNGAILDKGAYLSPSSYYYPQGGEKSSLFSLTAEILPEWESVSDGNLVISKFDEFRKIKIQGWSNPYESDGCMFMAAPYKIKSTFVNNIEVACFFFEEDTSLFDGYLQAAVGYMTMYDEMIGAYPYERFTIAENFFPTGYGMPGWTLLGQQVLRLPFIKFTSLGHEVLHNWWGNSVYVDYERGNWCEAATVYGADYRYKLNRSAASAKDYRKDILKQYVSYVNKGNDFPVREFKSRTSAESRTIGYNKAMMIYHMIEEEIGTDAFFLSWKDIYKNYMTQKISWEEWIETFEKNSSVDLSHVIPQWINQAGAPEISVVDVSKKDDVISFKLKQTNETPYKLKVPVRFTGVENSLDTFVVFSENETNYEMSVAFDVNQIEVDPEYHLFRKLYPGEVEPIVSGVLGAEDKKHIFNHSDTAVTSLFSEFVANMSSDSVVISYDDYIEKYQGTNPVMLNPPQSLKPEYLNSLVYLSSDSIFVNGVGYPKAGHTFILSSNISTDKKAMVIYTEDFESLPRIGQLVPHYGKYSYLVFEESKNIGKGQWPATDSPLSVSLK